MTSTAREVVELYNYVVWSQRNFDLGDHLVADTVIRHSAGEAITLTREQNRQRVEDTCASFDRITFELPVLVAGDDGEHVTTIWHATLTDADGDETVIANIEVFRVVGGVITEIYNAGHLHGYWR